MKARAITLLLILGLLGSLLGCRAQTGDGSASPSPEAPHTASQQPAPESGDPYRETAQEREALLNSLALALPDGISPREFDLYSGWAHRLAPAKKQEAPAQ